MNLFNYLLQIIIGVFIFAVSTSMLIAILGVIMIILAGIVVAYVGFSVVSDSLSGGVSSGAVSW